MQIHFNITNGWFYYLWSGQIFLSSGRVVAWTPLEHINSWPAQMLYNVPQADTEVSFTEISLTLGET